MSERAALRADLLAVAALASTLILAQADVVFGGRTLQTSQVSHGTLPGGAFGYPGPPPSGTPSADPGASAWTFQPHARLAHRLYAQGELPLWNPHEGLGFPFAAEMQTAPFSPVRLPAIACPVPAVEDATALARLFVAGLGAFLLARRLGARPIAALLSGVAFMLTGFFTAYVNTELDVDIQLPWVLLVFDRLLEKKTARALGVAACAVGLAIVGGFPESTFFVLAMAGIAFLFRALSEPFRAPSRRALAGDLGRFVAAVLLGHLLAAAVLLPFIEFLGVATVPEHPGSTGLQHYEASSAITLLVPGFFGPYYREWNRYGQCLFSAHYLGIVPVFLALLALGRWKHGRLAAFFAAFAGVALLKVYGVPGINQAIGSLPVFRLSFFSRYFQPEIALATALLAGLGLERLALGEVSRRRAAWTGTSLLVTLGVLVALHQEPLRKGAWRLALAPVGIEAGFLLVAVLLAWLQREVACVLLVALAALELARPVPRDRPLRHDPFVAPPYIEALERDPSAFRVFTYGKLLHPDTSSVFGIDDVRALEPMYPARYVDFCLGLLGGVFNDPPPGAAAKRLHESRRLLSLLGAKYVVSTVDLLSPERIDEIVATGEARGRSGKARFVVAGREREVFAQAPDAEVAWDAELPRHEPVLRFVPVLHPATRRAGRVVSFEISVAGEGRAFSKEIGRSADDEWSECSVDLARWAGRQVRLVLATRSLDAGPATLAGWAAVRLASPWEGLRCVHESPEARVFENAEVLPRAFVVHSARVLPGEKSVLEALADPSFDPRSEVLLEEGEAQGPPSVAAVSTATIVARSANRVSVSCSLGARGYLVVLDTCYPGWKALVDGVERPILRGDDLFRAVALGPGSHTVELVFRPAAFYWGVGVSAFGAALVVACVLLGSRRAGAW